MIKRNYIKIILIALLVLFLNVTISEASISASSKTVNSGEQVQISITSNIEIISYKVTVTSNGGLTFVTSAGGAGAGTTTITNASTTGMTSLGTFTFQAPTVTTDTTYKVSFNATAMDDINMEEIPDSSATATITVKAPAQQTPSTGNNTSSGNTNTGSSSNGNSSTTRPSTNTNTSTETETKSDNSSLSVLQIAEGAITPEFNSGTLEYQINVPNETTKLTITATPADSKAIVKIAGNEELVVGENAIEVIVTAENGSTTVYKINAVRAEAVLNLQALNVFYINENGEKIPLTLSPIFEPTIYEYTLENITHQIENLIIEGTATKENAEIQITGNEGLKEGENTVQIKVIVKDESGLEEVKTYTIKLNKEAAPVETPVSLWDRIKNWFGMAGTWIQTNIDKILLCSLIASTTALVGLTIYFIYDYKHYKKILNQLALMNKTNLMEKANVALATENMKPEETEQYEEGKNNEIEETNNIKQITETEVEEKQKNKTARGKRFRE